MPLPLSALIADTGPALPLTPRLRELYGGDLSLPERAVYANFVQSIDGVVTLPGVVSSGPAISGKNQADRFVMALLRACASAVLVGGATLRDTPGHHWTPEHVYPELAEEWAELRRGLGLPPQPRLAVLTAGGEIDLDHPAIQGGATFLTGAAAGQRIRERLPGRSTVQDFPGAHVPLGEAISWLHQEGHNRILSEAGPRVMGQLVLGHLVEDLFLTISPVLAGRQGQGRLGLIEGMTALPEQRVESRLASARTSGDFLMLRYALG